MRLHRFPIPLVLVLSILVAALAGPPTAVADANAPCDGSDGSWVALAPGEERTSESGTLDVYLTGDVSYPSGDNFALFSGADVTIDLCGYTLSITQPNPTDAAIGVPTGAELTVEDTSAAGNGVLTVTGGAATDGESGSGAGIGGQGGTPGVAGQAAGTVTIESGVVIATGGAANDSSGGAGAGIGGGGGGATYSNPGWPGGAGAAVTISGGNVSATGGASASSAGGAGAGIGGGGGATGDNYGDGEGGAGGALVVSGGTTSATGGSGSGYHEPYAGSASWQAGGGGAGIGGGGGADGNGNVDGAGGAGSTLTLAGGSLSATGGTPSSAELPTQPSPGAGIGGGGGGEWDGDGSGGDATINAGSGSSSLSGEIASSLSVSSGATLDVPSGQTLTLDGSGTNSGVIELAGALDGAGTLTNTPGSIDLSGSSWSIPGNGSGSGGLTITGNIYDLTFPSGTSPANLWVYADDLGDSGETLPSAPAAPSGEEIAGLGWEAGSTVLSSSTQLGPLASAGVIALTPAYQAIPATAPSSPSTSSVTPTTPSTSVTTTTPSPAPTTTKAPVRHHPAVKHAPVVRVTGPVNGRTYIGGYPTPVCHATVRGSTIKRCVISRRVTASHDGVTTIRITAKATSRAGRSATRSITIHTETVSLGGLPAKDGMYVVRIGSTYELIVASNVKPLYVDAAVTPQAPSGVHDWFVADGSAHGVKLWKLAVTLNTGMSDFSYWNLGIRTGDHTQILTIRT